MKIKQAFLSGIIFSGTVIISLVGFTVYAGSFDGITSMSQTWFNLINSKLNGIYTSGKMCTSDGSGQIQCITDVPTGTTGLGIGQTRQDVTASRTAGVTYTNTTGKPIYLLIAFYNDITIYLDGLAGAGFNNDGLANATNNISIIIPNNSTYKLTSVYGIVKWFELR